MPAGVTNRGKPMVSLRYLLSFGSRRSLVPSESHRVRGNAPLAQRFDAQLRGEGIEACEQRRRDGNAVAQVVEAFLAALLAGEPDSVDARESFRRPQVARQRVDAALEFRELAESFRSEEHTSELQSPCNLA